jgi:formamidopyrimidine-DNA glycosylase
MPELPEVETTRRGVEPWLLNQRIREAVLRHRGMRWPVRADLSRLLTGHRIRRVDRRSKYLLLDCEAGWLILHLGMSGSLRIVPAQQAPGKHDHFDLVLDSGQALRLTDPRRFGAVLWQAGEPGRHRLLRGLGPEPFDAVFDADWLYRRTRGRTAAIKNVLMDSHMVCGVGNIYANEALFRAGIHPRTAARRLSRERCAVLAARVRETLLHAIGAGGSSLRDYVQSNGQAGNFQSRFQVYDRAGEPCLRCGARIRVIRQGQRSTFYCPKCQRR